MNPYYDYPHKLTSRFCQSRALILVGMCHCLIVSSALFAMTWISFAGLGKLYSGEPSNVFCLLKKVFQILLPVQVIIRWHIHTAGNHLYCLLYENPWLYKRPSLKDTSM